MCVYDFLRHRSFEIKSQRQLQLDPSRPSWSPVNLPLSPLLWPPLLLLLAPPRPRRARIARSLSAAAALLS